MESVYINLNVVNSQKSSNYLYNNPLISKKNNLEFNYHYISTTTFGDLMDYIVSISQFNICPCYTFYCDKFKIDINQKITILNNFISKGILSSKSNISLTLQLNKCTCDKIFKLFTYPKYNILANYQENANISEAKIESLNTQLNQSKKKIEELENDIKVLKHAVKGDFATLNKLKEAGLANDLKPKNIVKVDPNTKKIKGNLNDYQYNTKQKDVIFENFYDVIIDIKSVSDINCKKGWKIWCNRECK